MMRAAALAMNMMVSVSMVAQRESKIASKRAEWSWQRSSPGATAPS
jgi:hypothetical protein